MLASVATEALYSAFGQVLRQTRLRRGLSQESLALDAGLDRTFISMLERGLRQPTLATLFALAAALNVKPSRFISDVERAL